MIVALVAALGENRVIGKDGGLPWHIPGDLKLFKQTTMGKPIIMGRKTWESLGRPLPGRTNIVITRKPAYRADGAEVAGDLAQALAVAGQQEGEEVMVIGGAEIYRLALPKADRLYLTEVALSPQGDALFPDFDQADWREISRQPFPVEEEIPAYTLVIYERT
ncbi:MAG: dihydrofolate reductase [Rhodospirillaceae bacterium]|nr:dihydrofolate reductase [Rhodospirillaceae bacterium]